MKKLKKFIYIFSATLATTFAVSVVASCSTPSLPPKLLEKNYVYDSTDKYYESLDGLSGKALISALIQLQDKKSKKQTHSYADLVDFYDKHHRDKYYDKDNSIIDVYSEINGRDPYTYPNYTRGVSSTTKEGKGLNREHIVPQSWFGRSPLPRSDVHFVFPSDAFVNEKRSANPHDNVVGNVNQTFLSGAKLGRNSKNDLVFEPNDMMKGDIARAYLYFAFTYAKNPEYRNSSFFEVFEPYLKEHYLKTYTEWNKLDSVDEFNIVVNNEAAKFNNGLRNPFIDYPNILESLFGENPKPFVNKGVLRSVKK